MSDTGLKQPWLGRRIAFGLKVRVKTLVARTTCFVTGHEWIEIQHGKYSWQGSAKCTKCGKEVSMITKRTIGGPEYPIEDDEGDS